MSRGKIFFWSGLAFLAGVMVASFWQPDRLFAWSLFLGGLGLAIIAPKKILVGGLIISCVGLGMLRLMQVRQLPDNYVSRWNSQEVDFIGTIVVEPEEREGRTKLTVAAEKISDQPITGRVLILAPRYPFYEYGQRLLIRGKLEAPENFADFDYQNYLARYGIYSTMFQPKLEVIGSGGNLFLAGLLKAKSYLSRSLQRVIPEPETGFALGILLGQQAAVGESVQESFRASGTMHVMAVSGYNITIVASLLIGATKWAGRRWSFFLALLGIVSFVLITGASASVVRAALMGGLVLLAGQVGRVSSVRNILLAAAVAMVAINPLVLRYDIGFQLSFLAVIGLVYVSPHLEKFLAKVPRAFMLRESLSATLSANIMTVPVTLVYFGQISPLAPLVNIILLPSIPLAMALSFSAALAGLIDWHWGQVLGYPAWLVLTYGLRVVKFGAALPGATLSIAGQMSELVLAIYVPGLALWFWLKNRRLSLFRIKKTAPPGRRVPTINGRR